MSEKGRTNEDVLPVEVIHRIQSLLPPKEAANTCMVSKSWLHAWYTIPTLRIIDPNPDKWLKTDEKATKFDRCIHATLQRYHGDNMPMESFHLCLFARGWWSHRLDVKNWIRLAVSKSCLKELSLDIGDPPYVTLPNEIFSSQNLYIISVRGDIRFPICTKRLVINCLSLRILDLSSVIITPDMFHSLLSTCTLLEKIKLCCCGGFKKLEVNNLLHLSELEIVSMKMNDLWEINNVPRLSSFDYRVLELTNRIKPIPFQIDSSARVTRLCIEGAIRDSLFLKKVESMFSVLESLSLKINFWSEEHIVITSASIKWLTLDLSGCLVINVQVDAPRLLSFDYTGYITGIFFRSTTPEQVKLTFNNRENLDNSSYFVKMREALINSSSKFDIEIRSDNLDSVVRSMNTDVDYYLRTRVLLPVGNVQLTLETCLDEYTWDQSRFFDALFLICHPSYIRSSYPVIRKMKRKMMEGKPSGLKEILLKNPHNEKWEALTRSSIGGLHRECKLIWFPQ